MGILPDWGISIPTRSLRRPLFFIGGHLLSFGGTEVDKFYRLAGQKNNDIWTFDFTTRKVDELGKTAVNLSPYKAVQKDSLFYLFGHPMDTDHNLLVDLNNNQVRFLHSHLRHPISVRLNQLFFVGTLYTITKTTPFIARFFLRIFSTTHNNRNAYSLIKERCLRT